MSLTRANPGAVAKVAGPNGALPAVQEPLWPAVRPLEETRARW